MMKKSSWMLLLCALPILCSADLKLMENGNPKCTVILRKDAAPPEKFAAKELVRFLGKIADGKAPEIAEKPAEGTVPVYLELTKDEKVKEEGFKITATAKELHIAGREPVGVLYGVFKVLKAFGGIRFLIPGEEGEYYAIRPTIAVPEGVIIENPSFAHRDISRVCMAWNSPVLDTLDWGVRNGMRFQSGAGKINLKNLKEGREARAVKSAIGGHCFSPLLTYNPDVKAKDKKAYVDKMFKEHPEYFPIIHGKRVITRDGGANPQPCTTNPDVIRIVAASAVRQFRNAPKPCVLVFGNNDTTQWCQCENCRKIDPQEEKDQGLVSTRYWTFANAVLDEIYKQAPDLRFEGWTYQNYSRAPKGIKPDKRVAQIMVSNHRRCWKHALDDKNCPTNKFYYDYNKEWSDTGVPFYSYDELSYAGYNFLPVSKPWVDVLKFYKKHMPNYMGTHTEICCPDGNYSPRFKKYLNLNNWAMMWQMMYIGMAFHWNVDSDYDAMYEEINSLYYGKGWDGGMREFRKLLTKLFMDAPGCWGYGHSVPVGKFLDVPGAKEKLYKLLDSAEKAASSDLAAAEKASHDPGKRALTHAKRALAHIKKDREFFEKTWIEAYKKYITNHRDIKLYPLMGKITVDGKLVERDWQNADRFTRFQKADGQLAKDQTSVRLAYDKDFLYMGIECFDSAPDKAVVNIRKHDGDVWEDNDVEIFINDPILGSAYFQIMINSEGFVCDGNAAPRFDKTWESGVKVAVVKEKDRFVMELAIPSSRITGSAFGPGTVLKMNVMRHKVTKGEPSEVSTWSIGTPHSVDVFHPISFAAPRMVSAGNRTEVNTSLWNNGSFDLVNKRKKMIYSHWKTNNNGFPASWAFSAAKQYGGDMEYLLHEGSTTNYYMRLRSGFIFNNYGIKSDVIRGSVKLRGKGRLDLSVLRYLTEKRKRMGKGTVKVYSIDVDSPEWKTYTFEFKRPGIKAEDQSLMLWPAKDSQIDVDDLFLAPK